MVQQGLIQFSFSTQEDFFAFIKGLRKAGVMKFQHDTITMDLMPDSVDMTNIAPDAEYVRDRFKHSLEEVMDAEKEEQELLFYSVGK